MSERAGAQGELIGGRYALGELLGVGGSASVFAATDTAASPPAPVAVKLLHPHLCADAASREAFLAEARQAARLRHANIVRVHDAGLHDAGGVVMPWIALDLLAGPTLRDWVQATGGRLAPHDAIAVVDGILAGLQAAHEAGIVHRDISPQNIVLDGAEDRPRGAPLAAGMVRILDFGLADVTGRSTVGSDILLAHDPDGAGHVVGNAHYMSPEQAQGLPVRAVGDLYQAGAVLYYALTGQPPFTRPTTEQVMRAHVTAPPPVPSAVNPAARPLDRIVTRALTKTPARRYRDAAEFREALTAAAATVPAAGPAAAAPQPETAATTVLPPEPGRDLDYLTAPAEAPADTDHAAARSSSGGPMALAVAALVALIAVAGVSASLSGAAGTSPDPAASPSPAVSEPAPAPTEEPPAPSPAASVAPTAPVEVALVAVPTLYGTLADAEAALQAAGLRLGEATRIDSAEAADRLLGQEPAAGTQVEPGAPVALTVASGRNTVPQVAGMSVATATAVLESAGFVVAVAQPATGQTVSGSDPAAGVVLRVGVTVALTLHPAATPAPTGTTGPEEDRR